jgi:hypothetical protein
VQADDRLHDQGQKDTALISLLFLVPFSAEIAALMAVSIRGYPKRLEIRSESGRINLQYRTGRAEARRIPDHDEALTSQVPELSAALST